MKKISDELIYMIALVLLSLSVKILTLADMGISTVVLPAYVLSQKISFLSFGQAEYVIQGCLLILYCLLVKKCRLRYLYAFVTVIIYGAVLDLWGVVIPAFHHQVTLSLYARIILFIFGMGLNTFSVALFYETYLYPQVYDFFVKGISQTFHINFQKMKTGFDCACLLTGVIMSLLFFQNIIGVGIGTLIMALCNGTVIQFFLKKIQSKFKIEAAFKQLEKRFYNNETEGGM